MSSLAELQASMSAALSDRAQDEPALDLVVGDTETARRRLAIYRGNVAGNATGALAAIYPIVHKLVGADFFNALALAYCAMHPSQSGDLNASGGELANFLQSFEPARPLLYLADVAQLEWHVHAAHFAADCAPLDLCALGALAETGNTRLKLGLHPAVAVVGSAYPLFRIWEVHQDDFEGECAVDLGGGGEQVVVFRPQFRTTVAKIAPAQAEFLNAVLRGSLFPEALSAALAVDAQFDLTRSLNEWVTANIVVAIRADTVK